MPPRWVIAGIVAFWMLMTGWLFFRELWPKLQPGQPPPFRIDLADEAQNNIPIRWSIFKDGEDRGYARTWVNFRKEDDTFELHGEFKLWKKTGRFGQPDFLVNNMYRVTREGELREIQASVGQNFKTPLKVQQEDGESVHESGSLKVSGEVRDGFFRPHIKIIIPPLQPFELDMKPLAMPKRASILNPLEPVNKLPRVRKGQHWRIPMVDPLAMFEDAVFSLGLSAGQKSTRLEYLDAEVLNETVGIKWGAKKEPVPCLVIEYQGDDISGHTWIQEDDGLVVGQEITQHGDKLELKRD